MSMNYENFFEKKEKLFQSKTKISKEAITAYTEAFQVIYAYNSAALSGNSISFTDAKIILDDKMGIARKSLNEIFELINIRTAFLFIINHVSQELSFDTLVEIYHILTQNIDSDYLNHKTPTSSQAIRSAPLNNENLKPKTEQLLERIRKNESNYNPVELAAYLHLEFIKLSPFCGYNDVIAGLISNHILLSNDFLPISISHDDSQKYFEAIKTYIDIGTMETFLNLAYDLEDGQLDCYIKMEHTK